METIHYTRTEKIHRRNAKTSKHEVIVCEELEKHDWGFSFLVDSELNAYKAAYEYRKGVGCKVEFSVACDKWLVTVFNEFAKEIGIC